MFILHNNAWIMQYIRGAILAVFVLSVINSK